MRISSPFILTVNIECEENVTLLGVNIDFLLNFDQHVSDIYKKASKQLAVLKRTGSFFKQTGQINNL